jgi:pyrroloquinoline quinone (PQQ) biosynthesis protein C
MSSSAIACAIDKATHRVRLLDHPYYQAWQNVELRRQDLEDYAQQYRHFERCLPGALSGVASKIELDEPRGMVEDNLADELSNPRSHLELFDDFAAAVGAVDHAVPSGATRRLIGLYEEATDRGPVAALAVIAAYETQAAEIAATKAASLSHHYAVDAAGTEFWKVHATLERQHSDWTVNALECLGAPPRDVELWAGRSARLWWSFLDERDAARTGWISSGEAGTPS